MKQNERLLVYAVTGFLALILVIAVVFGNDQVNAGNKGGDQGSVGLEDLVRRGPAGDDEAGKEGEGNGPKTGDPANPSGLKNPVDVDEQAPLRSKPLIAAERVLQLYGPSRRERDYRFVPVRSGDTLSGLVLRWTGDVDQYLDITRGLNEDKDPARLTVGDTVCVPWVEDDELVVLAEQRASRSLESGRALIDNPNRTLVTNPNASGGPAANGTGPDGTPRPSSRTVIEPGRTGPVASGPGGNGPGSAAPVAAGASVYTVKKNDALWKIAANRYGAGNADRMVKEIQRLNGLSGTSIQPGQKLKLPAGSE